MNVIIRALETELREARAEAFTNTANTPTWLDGVVNGVARALEVARAAQDPEPQPTPAGSATTRECDHTAPDVGPARDDASTEPRDLAGTLDDVRESLLSLARAHMSVIPPTQYTHAALCDSVEIIRRVAREIRAREE